MKSKLSWWDRWIHILITENWLYKTQLVLNIKDFYNMIIVKAHKTFQCSRNSLSFLMNQRNHLYSSTTTTEGYPITHSWTNCIQNEGFLLRYSEFKYEDFIIVPIMIISQNCTKHSPAAFHLLCNIYASPAYFTLDIFSQSLFCYPFVKILPLSNQNFNHSFLI